MLNETQQKIYNFLLERLQDGVPPSIREIGAHVGLKSTSSVQASLDALENEGFISRDPLLKRSIRIVGQEDLSNIKQVPILGTVTAGAPILAVEQIVGIYHLVESCELLLVHRNAATLNQLAHLAL